jgi:hypothetical protein
MFAGFRRPNFSALKAGCKYPDAHNTLGSNYKWLLKIFRIFFKRF